MITVEFVEIVKEHAGAFNLPASIIYGICMQESNGKMIACKYTPKYKWLFNPEQVKPKLCSVKTEKVFQKVSWGVMQCMGAVYRELGYTDWLPAILTDRYIQVMYGAKHLYNLKKRFPKGNDYIAAYNAGYPRRLLSGKYVNQYYVDKVIKHSKQWKKFKRVLK